MKLLKLAEEIVDKYYTEVNIPEKYPNVYRYRDEHEDKVEEEFSHPDINDDTLCEKYEKHIPKGWYGFAIGGPTPRNWFVVIDDILELCVKADPNFEIHQIKMKFGGIRFYCESDVIEDIREISVLIENKLYSKKLVY